MSIPYTLIRSRRKTISIQITPAGEVVVRCPSRMSKREVQAFVESRNSWVEKHLLSIQSRPQLPAFTEEELQALALLAKEDISKRVRFHADRIGVSYNRITIRSQHTRWGSCSSKGNINFNCLLMLMPPEVRDYVVVHELCHRKEMNHSPAFWLEVEQVFPNYREAKKWLKERGPALIGRLPATHDKEV